MMQLVERIILKVLVRVGVDGKVEKTGGAVSKNPRGDSLQKMLFEISRFLEIFKFHQGFPKISKDFQRFPKISKVF